MDESRIAFDAKDAVIFAARVAAWNLREGPRVGDFVRMPDNSLRRFTHDWGDAIQTTNPRLGDASFYLGDGYVDFSGSLDPAIRKDRLHLTEAIERGRFWMFHHGQTGARRGVHEYAPCRVYHCTPAEIA